MDSTTNIKEYRRKDGTVNRQECKVYRCSRSVNGHPVECDGPRSYRVYRVEETFQTVISELLGQLEALQEETILEYNYQVALQELRQKHQKVRETLENKQKELRLFSEEVVKSLQNKSAFSVDVLRDIMDTKKEEIEKTTIKLYKLEEKLENAEQFRKEIQIKQRKYCGLKYIFDSGTMEKKKMLLSIIISRVESGKDYQLEIHLAPDFERFLSGLIEMR